MSTTYDLARRAFSLREIVRPMQTAWPITSNFTGIQQEPYGVFWMPSDCPAAEFVEFFDSVVQPDTFLLIRDRNCSTIGYISLFDDLLEVNLNDLSDTKLQCIFDKANVISHEAVLSAEMNLFDAALASIDTIEGFGRFRLVKSGNDIVGWVSWEDFECLQFKTCLFSLLLEYEYLLLRLLLQEPEKAISVLSVDEKDGIRKRIIQIRQKGRPRGTSKREVKEREISFHDMLNWSDFGTKKEMVKRLRLQVILDQLKMESFEEFEDLSGKAVQYRNWCAHTGTEERGIDTSLEAVCQFIDSLEKSISS